MEQVKIYESLFKEVGKNQLNLSLDEQHDLLVKYHENGFDTQYSEQILKANLKLIMGICKVFVKNKSPNHPLYMDIHAKAFREALECLKRFRFDKGNCTVPSWIRNNVYRGVSSFIKANSNVVKYNSVMYDKIDMHRNAKDAFFTRHERPPVEGDDINFLYRGRHVDYRFTKDYEAPIFVAEDIQTQSDDGVSNMSIFDLIQEHDENRLCDEDEKYKKEVFKEMIATLPFRQRQITNLVYYHGYKIKDIGTKITPLTENELLKAERGQANVLKFKIKGKIHTLKVFVADYEIIDVQHRDKAYSFLLNEKYYTNNPILKFSLKENININFEGNIYRGVKSGNNYLYEIKMTKAMNPAIVRMTIDQEHKQARFNMKKYILKNKILGDL